MPRQQISKNVKYPPMRRVSVEGGGGLCYSQAVGVVLCCISWPCWPLTAVRKLTVVAANQPTCLPQPGLVVFPDSGQNTGETQAGVLAGDEI